MGRVSKERSLLEGSYDGISVGNNWDSYMLPSNRAMLHILTLHHNSSAAASEVQARGAELAIEGKNC